MLEGNVSTTNVRTHVRRDVRTYVKRDVRKLEEPFLVPPLPHYVSNMFLWIIFPGRHRFPFPDTLCGCKRSNPWEYYYLFLIPLLLLQSRFWRFWFHYPSDVLLSRFHWLVLLPIPQFAIDALNLD